MRRNGPICPSRFDLPRSLLVGILGFTSAAGLVQAGEIFKSTDANGQTVYSDHLDPSLSQSSLVQLDDARFPPAQLHFCWTNCFTLLLNDGVYRRADGTEESWTVETFSSDGIVLHRHDAPADWNGYQEDVVYAGQVSNDRLISVTVNGKPTSGVDASWGAALNTLPGSNAERDAKPTANLDSSSVGSVSSTAAPPPLPEEEQPSLSEDGALWTPGYWYWRDQAYVWIGGAWARPPRVGVLWTPAYWGTAGTVFVFHPGHWGPTVGFYGGVNYGYGYFGSGYTGGHWIGNSFAYNSAVNHVNAAVAHHLYAQSAPGQVSRGTLSYSAVPRNGDSAHTVPQPRSMARAANATVTSNAPDRTAETAPGPARVARSTPVAKIPGAGVSAPFTHVAPSTEPIK